MYTWKSKLWASCYPHNLIFNEFISIFISDGSGSFPIVMVGGVLEANERWDIGKEVTDCILKTYPGACPIRPKVSSFLNLSLVYVSMLPVILGCLSLQTWN